jgi:hypothetical protein
MKGKEKRTGKIAQYFYWFLSAVCLLAGVDAAMQVPHGGFTLCIFPYLAGGILFFPPAMERKELPLWLRWALFLTLIGGCGAMSAALHIPFVPIQGG